MPALITHDFFAHDVMNAYADACGDSRFECDAFLLGSQGPDPLFFGRGMAPYGTSVLGKRMHSEEPSKLLAALSASLGVLEGDAQPIGRAYAHGFLMHYLLDSKMHPLVYGLVESICTAGVEGLGDGDRAVVHHSIERELDEMVLYRKRGMTVREFKPTRHILLVNPWALGVIQRMYAYMALTVYGTEMAPTAFAHALAMYRLEQQMLYSPTGTKRAILGGIERAVRRGSHSYVSSVSHRAHELETTWFANPDHQPWEHPWTGEVRFDSFWDIYQDSLDEAQGIIQAFDAPRFDEDAARAITHDINFSGAPTVASLTVVKGD